MIKLNKQKEVTTFVRVGYGYFLESSLTGEYKLHSHTLINKSINCCCCLTMCTRTNKQEVDDEMWKYLIQTFSAVQSNYGICFIIYYIVNTVTVINNMIIT